MKKMFFKKGLVFYGFFFLISITVFSHLRFIGPDPYFSYNTFPQDIFKFKKKIVLFLNYTDRGWMGNLDDPELSPSPNYVSTEESITETLNGEIEKASFKGTWISPEFILARSIFNNHDLIIMPLLGFKSDFFRLRASGNAVAEKENFVIPFESRLTQNNSTGFMGIIVAKNIGDNIFSFMINYKKISEGTPSGFLNYNLAGTEYKLNRFTWGWSTTSSCNHIFGPPTNIDSFKQDYYIDSEKGIFDLVLGANIGNHKAAFRIRRVFGANAYFSYDDNLNKYVKDKWGVNIGKTVLRAYDVFPLGSIGVGKLFMVAFLEADFSNNPYTKNGKKLKSKYEMKGIEGELLPFIHFDLKDGGFVRIGTSASFAYGEFEYKDIWGSEEVILPGWVNFGWTETWERSSYGHFFRFINFSEFNMELRLSKRFMFITHLWTHLTYLRTKKIYGDTNYYEDKGFVFEKEAERKNVLKEFWMGGMFGVRLDGSVSFSLLLNLPIQYDNALSTEVSGIGGERFAGYQNPMPKVRRPIYLSLIIAF